MKYKFNINLAFDILNDRELKAIKSSIGALFNFLFETATIKEGKYLSEKIKDVWPLLQEIDTNLLLKYEYKIILLPLNRVGAQEGASGSRVFVTYFRFDDQDYCSSNPLIFKFDVVRSKKKKDKLADEKKNAESVIAFTDEHFAIPLYHSINGGYSFLWAPFTSSVYTRTNGLYKNPIIKENNLRKLIISAIKSNNKTKVRKVTNTLNTTYRYFKYWHSKNSFHKKLKKTYLEEYEWYLRDIDSWSKPWFDIWGESINQYVNDFNTEWINPFWILDRIKDMSFLFKVGAVHGDLHPLNIVISHEEKPVIIDFGWTQHEAHIVKDFALMEANIRFASLPPDYSYNYLHDLSKSIELDSLTTKKNDPLYLWLISIRHNFADIDKDGIFLDEYIIPLFLISLGLLKFTSKISNQVSARLTVLSLAKYIYDNKIEA